LRIRRKRGGSNRARREERVGEVEETDEETRRVGARQEGAAHGMLVALPL
jgi:hypothetical protein